MFCLFEMSCRECAIDAAHDSDAQAFVLSAAAAFAGRAGEAVPAADDAAFRLSTPRANARNGISNSGTGIYVLVACRFGGVSLNLNSSDYRDALICIIQRNFQHRNIVNDDNRYIFNNNIVADAVLYKSFNPCHERIFVLIEMELGSVTIGITDYNRLRDF